MATKTVKVQYVNQPKEGKRFGSIKAEDGTYYGCKPEMLSQLSRGGSYEIE